MTAGTIAERVNQRILLHSMGLTILYTVIALIASFLTASQMILFDGIYNLVGLALTYVSIFAIKFIQKSDNWNYPFGKATLEPFVAILQYAIVFYICATTALEAFQVILSGGRPIDLASGIMYGAFAGLFNIGVCLYLNHITKKFTTAIAEAEKDQWKFNCYLSVGIFVGFTISWLLGFTPLIVYTPYIDSILTILVALIFGKTAFVAIRGYLRELLSGTPTPEITQLIHDKIEGVNQEYRLPNHVMRLGKVGGKLIIEIDYVIEQGTSLDSIVLHDQIRDRLTAALGDIPYEKWLNVNFMGDSKWCEHAS